MAWCAARWGGVQARCGGRRRRRGARHASRAPAQNRSQNDGCTALILRAGRRASLPIQWMRHGANAFSTPTREGHAAPLARGYAACRCTRSCLKRSKVDWLQGCLRWPAQHGTSGVEARAVAGTIPGTIGRVPADQALQMRADGGTDRQVPCVIAIRRVFLPVQAHDFSCPVGHVVEGVCVSACEHGRGAGSTDNPDSPAHTARGRREKAADPRGTGRTRDSSGPSSDPAPSSHSACRA